jgi:hypothetical protein
MATVWKRPLRERFWTKVASFAAKRTGRAFIYGASVNLADLVTTGGPDAPVSSGDWYQVGSSVTSSSTATTPG